MKISPENLLQLFLITSSADDCPNDQELLESLLQILKLVMMMNKVCLSSKGALIVMIR